MLETLGVVGSIASIVGLALELFLPGPKFRNLYYYIRYYNLKILREYSFLKKARRMRDVYEKTRGECEEEIHLSAFQTSFDALEKDPQVDVYFSTYRRANAMYECMDIVVDIVEKQIRVVKKRPKESRAITISWKEKGSWRFFKNRITESVNQAILNHDINILIKVIKSVGKLTDYQSEVLESLSLSLRENYKTTMLSEKFERISENKYGTRAVICRYCGSKYVPSR